MILLIQHINAKNTISLIFNKKWSVLPVLNNNKDLFYRFILLTIKISKKFLQ